MKKLIIPLFPLFILTTIPRFGTTKNKDKTARNITYSYSAPVYGATLAIVPKEALNLIIPGTLTGAMTVNATLTGLQIADRLVMVFTADGTNRVVTFGTGMVSSGTLTVTASKKATVEFIFDDVALVETNRTITV